METSVRVAGWAMLGFAVAFLATFTANLAVSLLAELPEYPLAAEMQAMSWDGVVFMLLWGSAGVALGIAAPALRRVVWPDGGLAAQVSTIFGTIAAGGWLFSGAAVFAQRTALLNGNISAVEADPAAERAVVEGLFVLVHVGGVVFALAAVPWIGTLAVGAARRERMSRIAVGSLWVAAVAPLLGFLVIGHQIGIVGTVLGFGLTGILLLRRRRRGATGARARAAAPPAGA
jgi:hypothetical protein